VLGKHQWLARHRLLPACERRLGFAGSAELREQPDRLQDRFGSARKGGAQILEESQRRVAVAARPGGFRRCQPSVEGHDFLSI